MVGAIHLTESDALVMSALLVGSVQAMRPAGGAAQAASGARARLALRGDPDCGGGRAGAQLPGCATKWSAVGAARDASLWMGYGTALNGPRVAKGFVWAVLLLPLLGRPCVIGRRGATRWLVWGLVAGAVLVALAVVWERGRLPGCRILRAITAPLRCSGR